MDFIVHGTAGAVCAVILFTMLGLACGNYATSIIFRMPVGVKIPNDPPYCDSCRAYLEVRDLFPFFSWLINRGKCRFCGVAVPALYAVVEWSSVVLFVLGVFQFGVSEQLVVALFIGMLYIILAAHHYQQGRFYIQILLSLAGMSAVFRTLVDGNLHGIIQGCYWGLVIGLIPWGWRCMKAKTRLPYPETALVPVLAGAALGNGLMIAYLVLGGVWWTAFLALASVRKDEAMKRSASVMAAAVSVITLILYPNLPTATWSLFFG
jgi:prepilin signal peptidase PulO-like enzyme (type II secretory pathway)